MACSAAVPLYKKAPPAQLAAPLIGQPPRLWEDGAQLHAPLAQALENPRDSTQRAPKKLDFACKGRENGAGGAVPVAPPIATLAQSAAAEQPTRLLASPILCRALALLAVSASELGPGTRRSFCRRELQ